MNQQLRPSLSPSFDFTAWAARASEMTEAIRAFAAHPALRSARVEELELDDDFHRRALRPEDLSFIRFSESVTEATVNNLPFLAAQRLLLSINELDIAGAPNDGSVESFARVEAFYDEAHRLAGAQIRPFLEAFAFGFVADAEDHARDGREARAELEARLRAHLQAEARHWRIVLDRFRKTNYVEAGLRYALIQGWSLAASKRAALARAVGARFFEPLGPELSPRLINSSLPDAEVRRLASHCGLAKQQHSYWQFYLSTSLASCNLLYALTRSPARALRAYGAAFAAEAEWLAYGCLVGAGAEALGLPASSAGEGEAGGGAAEALSQRFARGLAQVEQRWGTRGLAEVASGLAVAMKLASVARRNLGEQLRWLSSMGIHQEIARRIDTRIRTERPDIDRETFVEPREMCSTTHVHDDHRLVAIESGNMVFWGNLGTVVRLAPGEMVLVPRGRLHGSSIESNECVYHQPIVPEDWIVPLHAALDPGGSALLA